MKIGRYGTPPPQKNTKMGEWGVNPPIQETPFFFSPGLGFAAPPELEVLFPCLVYAEDAEVAAIYTWSTAFVFLCYGAARQFLVHAGWQSRPHGPKPLVVGWQCSWCTCKVELFNWGVCIWVPRCEH